MRGSLETIVGAMFAGKTSELLKRILWAKHQNKKIIIILGVVFLLLIINISVNMFATSKIDDEIQTNIRDLNLGDDVEIEYDDISYSFISSTLSFENILIILIYV